MRFDFAKCHGSGNDFPLIDARDLSIDDSTWASVARALADRRGPIGGDGMLLVVGGGMRMFNADGSEAETCLNGLRCVARATFAATGTEQATLRLATSSAEVARDADLAPGVYTVRETAGPASLDIAAWPLHGMGAEIVDTPIPMLPSARAFTAVAMPNPHLVSFVDGGEGEDAIDEAELVRVGLACEAAPAWLPNRANVSFVRGTADGLFVRTHERGVGLTDSCGSAMAASVFAACLTGRAQFDVELNVFNRGGMVLAEAARDGMVRLSGNATWEYEGSVEVDLDREIAGDLRITRRHDAETAAWSALIERIAQGQRLGSHGHA